jgi:hypothetical protein
MTRAAASTTTKSTSPAAAATSTTEMRASAAPHAAAGMGTAAATATTASAASGSRIGRARKQDRHADNGQEFEFRHNTLLKRPARQEAAQTDDCVTITSARRFRSRYPGDRYVVSGVMPWGYAYSLG